jgi:hypothetical protein
VQLDDERKRSVHGRRRQGEAHVERYAVEALDARRQVTRAELDAALLDARDAPAEDARDGGGPAVGGDEGNEQRHGERRVGRIFSMRREV